MAIGIDRDAPGYGGLDFLLHRREDLVERCGQVLQGEDQGNPDKGREEAIFNSGSAPIVIENAANAPGKYLAAAAGLELICGCMFYRLEFREGPSRKIACKFGRGMGSTGLFNRLPI